MNDTYISLDLEMTSIRPENQEVIEIAAIKFRGERVLESWSTLVNPQCSLPYNIQVLTGINPDDLVSAPTLSAVAPRFLAFIGRLPLVAHSVSADVGCLRRKGIILDNPQLDTFELASVLLPQMHSYSLASLVQHFGIPFPNQHRAAADALVTKELFLKLWYRALDLDIGVIQEINRLVAGCDWPLKSFFAKVERQKGRTALGTSIRQQLQAKGLEDELPLEVLMLGRRADEPLVPRSGKQELDAGELVWLIGAEGRVAQGLPGYEYRPEQVEMLEAVVAAFNDDEHLVVEAGTGTGKSLAYLLPSAFFSMANGERVVVSTNTINLQDQLYQKDIPDLQKILDLDFKAALVKGRSNYLCLQRWTAMRRRRDLSPSEIQAVVKTLVWLPSTESGDAAELNLIDGERGVWQKICASAEHCTPKVCRYLRRGTCFLSRARKAAESANIVVVNHALLISDLAADNAVLPDYRYLVIDEAHHLESVATDQLGYQIRQRRLLEYLDDLDQEVGPDRSIGLLVDIRSSLRGAEVPTRVRQEIDSITQQIPETLRSSRVATADLFSVLGEFARRRGGNSRGYEQRLRVTPAVRDVAEWASVEQAWERLALRLADLQESLMRLYQLYESLADSDIPDYDVLIGQLQASLGFNHQLRIEGNALVVSPDPGRIYWVSLNSAGETGLNAVPLHVGEILARKLFDHKHSAILTSATLMAAGTFDYIKGRLGLEDARELEVGSPFDYARSALLYVPTDIPEPEQHDYQRHVQQALIELCAATEGRALVLFTSHNQLRQTWQAIHKPLAEQGILVLGHGVDGSPRRQLLQTFKTNPKTVLLGASSFWEGIDVVGDALSVLVITRLPFAVPSDPVFAARSELFRDPFHQYSVPQTILRFKQGFGRLIRSGTDRGVIVVLDRRIKSKSYGQLFLRSLPPCNVKTGVVGDLPGEALEWLSSPDVVRPSGSAWGQGG